MAKKDTDPRAAINQINEIIRSKNFKNVHLLCGEEDYLRHQFRDSCLAAMGAVPGSMSYDRFAGKDTSPERIIDLAETMPFFADHRVILIEDTGWLEKGNETMAKYIEQGVCESTYILFCEEKADARTGIYQAIKNAGMVTSFDTQDEQTLRAWLISKAKKQGYEMSGGTANYLCMRVGNDMLSLSNELDKLMAYCLGRVRITTEDIDAVCSRKLEDNVYDMCTEISLGHRGRAFAIYQDLNLKKEAIMKILSILTSHIAYLVAVKDLEIKRKSDKEIAGKIKKTDWIVRKYKMQTSHFTLPQLKQMLEMCALADENIKTGRMSDRVALELLLVELSEV